MKRMISKHKKAFFLLLFLLSLSLLALLIVQAESDYWWHIKVGERIVLNKEIPFYDVFSWFGVSNHLYFMSHEWGSEVILYFFKVLFGKYHLVLFVSFFFLLLMTLLFLFNKKGYLKNVRFSIVYGVFALILIGPTLAGRPHMISYVLLAVTLYLLFSLYKNENSKKIYFLPIVSIIWANCHGGSSNLPYLLSFAFFFIGLFNFKFGSIEMKAMSKKMSITFLVITILSFLAVMVNPHGLKMISYPYINMRDSFMLQTIVEWRAVDANKLTDFGILGFLLFLIILLIKSKKNHDFLKLCVLGFFCFLTLKSIRFAPLLYIASSFIIFDYIEEKKYDEKINIVLLITSFLLILYFAFHVNTTINNSLKSRLDDSIITYIKEEKPKRLYNFYNYGGYLIYKEIPVFIDGRADMYSNYNFKDSYYLLMLKNDYEKILDKYDFDMFLLEIGCPLDYYLKSNDKYQEVMREDSAVIYKLI